MANQNDLLGAAHAAFLAEIDALGETDAGVRRAQPPAAPARQTHQYRLPALRQRRLDRRMKVEAHDEAPVGLADRLALGAGEDVLAAQVAAIGRQPQAAAMNDAVERAIAIVAHVEPLRAV